MINRQITGAAVFPPHRACARPRGALLRRAPALGSRRERREGERVSQTDSFVEEVTEELRRDRLFAAFRRWGPFVLAALVLIVGASAWNEWRRHEAERQRQEAGDALRAALAIEAPQERLAALDRLAGPDWPAPLPLAFARAAAEAEAGRPEEAEGILRAIMDDAGADQIYRDLARLRLLSLRPGMAPEERRALLDPMVGPDAPFRLLALEQRAVAWIDADAPDKAIADLRAILADPLATGDLRFRAAELMRALGADPDREGGDG